VAQLVAHLHGMQRVRGSSPLSSTHGSAGPRQGCLRPADSFVAGTVRRVLTDGDGKVIAVVEAASTAVASLLRHRLYRSELSAQPIDPEFTRLHHPARWHFDVLRGLDALADAAVSHDSRMHDGLELLVARRRSDGRWAANRAHPGATYLPPAPVGRPSPWITLIALRVMKAYAERRQGVDRLFA
jgi:hypothetical protein